MYLTASLCPCQVRWLALRSRGGEVNICSLGNFKGITHTCNCSSCISINHPSHGVIFIIFLSATAYQKAPSALFIYLFWIYYLFLFLAPAFSSLFIGICTNSKARLITALLKTTNWFLTYNYTVALTSVAVLVHRKCSRSRNERPGDRSTLPACTE